MAVVAEQLDVLPGVRHVGRADAGHDRGLVTADVSAGAADVALETLTRLTFPAEDIALVRLDCIAPLSAEAEPLALEWADLLGQARVNSRTAVRYLVFMAVAGLVAAFGVIDNNQILIVGAMAVSPDLLQTHVNSETLLVALAAGVAGMLALETRASAAQSSSRSRLPRFLPRLSWGSPRV
jgi:hypothetical protein